jgi:hypothetical protein
MTSPWAPPRYAAMVTSLTTGGVHLLYRTSTFEISTPIPGQILVLMPPGIVYGALCFTVDIVERQPSVW